MAHSLPILPAISAQIGFLIQSITEANSRSIAQELTQVAGYGLDASIVLLEQCLDQLNSEGGDMQHMQLKLEILALVFKHLMRQPNFCTIFCEAVRNVPCRADILDTISKIFHLTSFEQICLGLALADSGNETLNAEGLNFCKEKITEIKENGTLNVSEEIAQQIFLFIHQSEGLLAHLSTFLQALFSAQPEAQKSLLLAPLSSDELNIVNCQRSFDPFSESMGRESTNVMSHLEEATDAAEIIQELGYGCTIDVTHCKDILSLYSPLKENRIAQIVSTVARTHSGLHTGLEDPSGTLSIFHSSNFNSSISESTWISTWNIDVLVDAIKEIAPKTDWISVAEFLDHDSFYLPDQKALSILISIFKKASEEVFPLNKLCGKVWNNVEGQLSFLKNALSGPSDVVDFGQLGRNQALLERLDGTKIPFSCSNQAWLSIDLVEILCHLSERGLSVAVRNILDEPLKNCPEYLLVVVSQVKTPLNQLQHEIFSKLFASYLGKNPDSNIVMHFLWNSNPNIFIWSMVDTHGKDPNSIFKILETCDELKILSVILDKTPFSFAIELASYASKKEILDFEKWLTDGLTSHKDTFFEACLKFLQAQTSLEAASESSVKAMQQTTPENLSLEVISVFFKVLQAYVGQLDSRELAEEMKRLHAAAVRINPRLLSVGTTESSSSTEVFTADVEEEANSYFQRVYHKDITCDSVINMLARYKESSEQREKEIFNCMLQSLFEEYQFFSRYPEDELHITAILFGSLVKHQLVSSLALGVALRYVLDALRKPLDSKMFSFGLTALEQFKDRLVEWPQYCNHILQISHLRDAHIELIEFIDGVLGNTKSTLPEQIRGNQTSVEQIDISSPRETTERQQNVQLNGFKPSSHAPVGQVFPYGQVDTHSGTKPSISASGQAGAPSTTSLLSSGAGLLCNTRGTTLPASRQSYNGGFGHALNIETLVAAAERRDIPIEAPSLDAQDKIAFIINNISTNNLEVKSKEFLDVLKEENYPWFAQYMVMKRASIEPNFHDLYLKFLDKINSKTLHKEVIKATYENCKVLLRSELIKSSSEERSLLKNLGSWLGKLTIGRNQALRAREIDPKLLIIEAYEKGLMIAVIPFTSKVLEPCQSSLAYQPPNPWTMGILNLLAEIYALPNLKMNLRFDIEVLFKNLGVEMKDAKPTQLLKGRAREIEGNPDFANKDISTNQPPIVSDHTMGPFMPLPHMDGQPDVTASHPSASHMPTVPQFSSSLPPSQPPEDDDIPLSLTDHMPAGMTLTHTPAAPAPFSVNQISLSTPNVSNYVVINPKLSLICQHMPLNRLVPLAMERAITEIINPVVERSVTIACFTSRELVLKDYALEADEARIRQASRLIVASLAGSLAHVTCKEPLRHSMVNQLRTVFQAYNLSPEIVEQSVQLVTNDNLDLGCAIIEQHATDKAIHDLDDVIGPNLAVRRKHRESFGPAYFEAALYGQGNLARLPEALRPKPGQLSPAQQRVYEDFARLPWQNQPSQNSASTTVVPTTPSASSAGPGFSRGPYDSSLGNTNSVGYNTAQQSEIGAAQTAEQPPEEVVGYRVASPHSVPSSQVVMPELGIRSQVDVLQVPCASSTFLEGQALEMSNLKEAASTTRPSTPSAPTLNTGEALEKYQVISQKLDSAILKGGSELEIQGIVLEVSDIILQCVGRDEGALAIAQKVFRRLYENASNNLHVTTHIAVLAAIRDVCKRVVKELTSWVVYSDEERKFNKDIMVALIRSDLINLTEYNMHLAKLVDGGRNAAATEFAIFLVQTCVLQEPGVSATELYNLIEALGKVAQRSGSPESLQQLMDDLRNASHNSSIGKEKSREKKALSGRVLVSRDDSKQTNLEVGSSDSASFREQVTSLFEEWIRLHESPGVTENTLIFYVSQLQQSGMLRGEDSSEQFFRILTELAVQHCLSSEGTVSGALSSQNLSFAVIDMYSKLVFLLVKYHLESGMSKINLLNKVLASVVRVIQRDSDEKKTAFHPRPYFRLFVNWIMDFSSLESAQEPSNFQVLSSLASTFHSIQPLKIPGLSFAWLELISHRLFMSKLLLSKNQKGWPFFQRLLVDLFKFMEPYLRHAELKDPVKLLYKGTLRVLLVLLHDFPEFLCDYHFSFCDVIPPSCIQMRNLILSAFPRNMRLPDPFTPNLKVDLLPDISQSPRILSDVEGALKVKQLKAEVDEYLKTRQQMSVFLADLKQLLMLPQHDIASAGTKYNVPLINSLVLYVGMQAIQQLQSQTTPKQLAITTTPITHSAPMDIFQKLILELDTEGRYLFLNAVANQLRYPNNHTHYFSCVLLYLFAEANQEIIQEQITRVLLERLIVNRPHPWGLLITFIELIKNPRYNFWSHGFTHCAPDIEKLFESVARSCMGPSPSHQMKAVEDDLASNMSAESNQ